jgi:hypothetical protein
MWESTFTKSNTFAEVITEVNKEKQLKTKIDQVGKLIDVAVILGIFHNNLFDDLMDKYEKAPDLFEYTYSTISSMIFRKYDIETVKEKYQQLLSFRNINQINQFTYF